MNTSTSTFKRNTKYRIIDGPSRDMLFDAVKYAYDRGINILIEFEIEEWDEQEQEWGYKGRFVPTVINSIEHECGSGSSFNIEGHSMNEGHFEAYYSSRSRQGHVVFGKR